MLFKGIYGTKIFEQNNFAYMLVDAKNLVDKINDGFINIPIFQREIITDKINKIIRLFIKEYKKGDNIFIQSDFKIASYSIGSNTYHLLVDGQHRFEAIKILMNKNYNIGKLRVSIKNCKNYKECQKYFKYININTDMNPIYTDLQSSFYDKLILELKCELKQKYNDGFSNKKNNKKYYHLDDFLGLFSLDNLKNSNYVDKNKQLKVKMLLLKLEKINSQIKETIKFEEFTQYTQQKLLRTNIYISFKNVNLLELILNDDTDIKIIPELITNIKTKTVEEFKKSLSVSV